LTHQKNYTPCGTYPEGEKFHVRGCFQKGELGKGDIPYRSWVRVEIKNFEQFTARRK